MLEVNNRKNELSFTQNTPQRGVFTAERDKIKITSATLTDFERIMSMTYIDELLKVENEHRLVKKIGNGIKSVDISMAESMKIDRIVEKVAEVVERKTVEPTVQYQPPKPPRR